MLSRPLENYPQAEREQWARKLVEIHVKLDVSELMGYLWRHGNDLPDYCTPGKYFAVSEWLGQQLMERDRIVIRFHGLVIWKNNSEGCALHDIPVIQLIAGAEEGFPIRDEGK